MKNFKLFPYLRVLGLSSLFFVTLSCQKEFEIVSVIYENNFNDTTQYSGITNALPFEFNNSLMLGNYHDGGFRLDLIDLPSHQILQFEFDLYIMDSWDVNDNNGPDRWIMEVRKEWDFDQRSVEDFIFETTFSNTGDPSRSLCFQELYCNLQSYPNQFPSFNLPRTGAIEELNGYCHNDDLINGTMRYRITQTILHDYSELHLFIYDSLVQDNAFSEPCDESWALDNLKITAFDEI